MFATRVYAGERREDALLVGIDDYERQQVNVVHVVSGTAPRGGGTVLTEQANAKTGRFEAGPGDSARVVAADGSTQRLRITGEGRNIDDAQDVTFEETVVLYTTPETVARIGGRPGVSELAFRLHDPSPAAAERTLAAVQDRLESTVPGFTGFAELPAVREPGDWPGKEEFSDFSSLFYIVTVLALLSAWC